MKDYNPVPAWRSPEGNGTGIRVKRRENNSLYIMWLYVFLGSFLLGILIMNMSSQLFLNDDGIFNAASISRIKYLEVDHNSFFKYSLRQRIKGYLVLLAISTTALGLVSTYLCVIWQGIMTGMVITAATIRFGLKGLLLILAGLFPHQLLLIPAGIMMMGWCYQNCCAIHFPHKCSMPVYRNRKQHYIRQAVSLIWIVGVVVIGCILECYVNPILISDLIKIF